MSSDKPFHCFSFCKDSNRKLFSVLVSSDDVSSEE